MLGLVGVMLLAFGGLTAMQHRLRFSRHGVVHCFSGGILPIYLVHMIVGVRLYALTVRHINPTAVMATLSAGWHPVLMLAFPVMLLFLSWGVGYGTVVCLHDKRFRIRLRCTALART